MAKVHKKFYLSRQKNVQTYKKKIAVLSSSSGKSDDSIQHQEETEKHNSQEANKETDLSHHGKQNLLQNNSKQNELEENSLFEDLPTDFLDDAIVKTLSEIKAEDLDMILGSNDQIFEYVLKDSEQSTSIVSEFDTILKNENPVKDRKDTKISWLVCTESQCGFWTRKPERMSRHKLCHDGSTKTLRCPDCNLKFFSLAKFLKHDRICHTGIKDYECQYCDAEVTDIKGHMRIHTSERHLKCSYCSARFKHRSGLIRHIFLHTGHRPYKCHVCQAFFTGRDRIRDHFTRQHSHLISDTENLEKLLDNSRNRERLVSTRYNRNEQSSVRNVISVSDFGHLTLQTGQSSFLFQIVSSQDQNQYEPSPRIQNSSLLMQTQIPILIVSSNFESQTTPLGQSLKAEETTPDVAMGDISMKSESVKY